MSRREDGFTLVELLIAVSLSTILIGALAGGIFTYIRTADGTINRLSETPQLQVAATRFGSDVQSASSVELPAGVPSCAVPAGATWIGTFRSIDPGTDVASTADDTAVGVSYSYRTVATATQKQVVLERSECRGSAAPVVASLANSGNPGLPPALTCAPAACGPLARVDLSLHVCTADAAGTCRDDDLAAVLTGTRRF